MFTFQIINTHFRQYSTASIRMELLVIPYVHVIPPVARASGVPGRMARFMQPSPHGGGAVVVI